MGRYSRQRFQALGRCVVGVMTAVAVAMSATMWTGESVGQVAAQVPTASGWTITDLTPNSLLSYSSASDVSNQGLVVGGSDDGAFVWSEGGGLLNLAPPSSWGGGGGDEFAASAISEGGQVVGCGHAGQRTFMWAAATGMVDLTAEIGGDNCAFDINDLGQIVGHRYLPPSYHFTAFLWRQGAGVMTLPMPTGFSYSSAQSINEHGEVAGWAQSDSGTRGIIWRPDGSTVQLTTLGGSYGIATDINDQGQAVGTSTNASDTQWVPLLWNADGSMVSLGTLGGFQGSANAINNRGDVVGHSMLGGDSGTHAFYWSPDEGMVDLGTLNGDLSIATGINDQGQVVGFSRASGDYGWHAVLWTPPNCPASTVNASGDDGARHESAGASPSVADQNSCPSFTIGIRDGSDDNPPIVGSELVLLDIPSIGCGTAEATSHVCRFEWWRSKTQTEWESIENDYDGLNQSYGFLRYIALPSDVGHRFFLRVTNERTKRTLDSNILAIGPANNATPLHPLQETEPVDGVRVNQPYFSFQNAEHHPYTPPNGVTAAPYTYEIRVRRQDNDETVVTTAEAEELSDNHGITYARAKEPLIVPGIGYNWQVRTVVAGAPGRWRQPKAFHLASSDGLWSSNGQTWHWPYARSGAIQTGSFFEAYYHASVHAGLDLQLRDLEPIYASRNGRLVGLGLASSVALDHGWMEYRGLPKVLCTRYLHMSSRTTLPAGVMLNQGDLIGLQSNLGTGGGGSHLHLELFEPHSTWCTLDSFSQNGTTYHNPLYVFTPEDDPQVQVESLYFRRPSTELYGSSTYSLLDSAKKGISSVVDVIGLARARRYDGRGAGLNPYQIRLEVNGQVVREHRFDAYEQRSESEAMYFAYADAASTQGQYSGSPRFANNKPYWTYLRWDGVASLTDRGPATFRYYADEFPGDDGPVSVRDVPLINNYLEATIGPRLVVSTQRVCGSSGSSPVNVTVTVWNMNSGALENSLLKERFDVVLGVTGSVSAEWEKGTKWEQIESHSSVPNTLVVKGGTGTVTVRAKSGIITDISDAKTIDVVSTCD